MRHKKTIVVLVFLFLGAATTTAYFRCLEVKGNYPSMIYHVPGCSSYDLVKMAEGDRWFMNEEEAKAAGFTKAKNCPDL